MSLKKSLMKLDVLVATLDAHERAALAIAWDRVVRGMFGGLAAVRAAIPDGRLATFGGAMTDVVTSAMISYGFAVISPSKRKPVEALGAELEKALPFCPALPELAGPLAEQLKAPLALAPIDPVPAVGG